MHTNVFLFSENFTQVEDIDGLIQRTFDGVSSARASRGHDLAVYHDFIEIESWLLNTVDAHEDATVTSIGQTHENREIYSVNIFNRPENLESDDVPKEHGLILVLQKLRPILYFVFWA